MAKYFEVLNQGEQNVEEVGQFFANVEPTQTVQYVIAPEDHQQTFQTQQIVVVEGQQPVILDQSQITYQGQPQYIIDAGIQFAQREQQIFYMESSNGQQLTEAVVDQTVQQSAQIVQQNVQTIQQQQQPIILPEPQPIVLNHQLSGVKTTTGVVHGQNTTQTPRLPTQQVRLNNQVMQPVRTPLRGPRPQIPVQIRPGGQPVRPALLRGGAPQKPNQNFPQNARPSNTPVKVDEVEAVALPDGTIVSVAVYKRMITEQKLKNMQTPPPGPQQQIRPDNVTNTSAQTPVNTPTQAQKKRGGNRVNNRSPRSMNRGGARAGARGGANNVTPIATSAPPRFMLNPLQNQQPQSPAPTQQPLSPAPTQPQPRVVLPQNPPFEQNPNIIRKPPQPAPRPVPKSQANYIIQPPSQLKLQPPKPLPSYIQSSQIQQILESTPVCDESSDSIRMLVLVDNGEQRLITFTLPKEACTIQEILEQVNLPFQKDTRIQVFEASTNGINYLVTVGDVPNFGFNNDAKEPDESAMQIDQPQMPPMQQPQQVAEPAEPPKPPSPEPIKEVPKFIPGKLALCKICGYLSEDFNKCMRCNRKLPEDVKSVQAKSPANGRMMLRDNKNAVDKKVINPKPNNGNAALPKPANAASPKKKPAKPKIVEHETVCLVSSDEEDDAEKVPVKSVNQQLLSKLGSSISISPVTKEPSLSDIQKHVLNKTKNSNLNINQDDENKLTLKLDCRTVRIGSYRVVPKDKVLIESTGLTIIVPHTKVDNDIKTVKIAQSDIVRVLINFNRALPVIFYYLIPSVGNTVRELLGMDKTTDRYFNPIAEKDESQRRITLLVEEFTETEKSILQDIYSGPPFNILDELSSKEANDILVKTCPRDLSKTNLNVSSSGVKQLFQYPPEGKGRLSINTEDYICLASDQFLNDVIIDFYLKYLVNNLPDEQQEKVHVFSTFFYKRLTTKPQKASRKCQPSELDSTLTAAQKRHARVKTWTKNVNLFEKDFVIVPINENAHWFLAIICFPGMKGCHTFDGQPYKLEAKSPRKKKETVSIGNVTLAVKKETIVCDDPEMSDKDEAEGDDSEMDSDDSEELARSQPTPPVAAKTKPAERPPIKQPCILIFDSLAGNSRSRVVATLRDYLTCEYKVKMGEERVYNKDVIKGSNVKVPQQTNFTDCGLYVLQYVEHFFMEPILDYNIPIKQLKNWFDEIIVTRKREELANLIKDLMVENDQDLSILPKIRFPTINGELVERGAMESEEEEEEEEDNFTEPESSFEDEEYERESGEIITAPDTTSSPEANASSMTTSQIKPSESSECGSVIGSIKPDISEFPRHTNKDTLNYLKSKRIIRHKMNDGPEPKKSRNS